jgi:hypothetical protein
MAKASPSAEAAGDRLFWARPWFFAALLGLALGVYFYPTLLGGRSFFYRDYGVLGYPVIAYARERFWRGELPLWNPLSDCGAPFLAQWGSMTLYPFSLIYLTLPLPWSLDLFCVLHLFWGGLGTYRLLLTWTRGRLAPAIGGLLFALNGVTLSCLIWPNYAVALGWMPWVVLFSLEACSAGGVRVIHAAFAAALQLLAGVPEIVVLTWSLILLLAVSRTETRRIVSIPRLGGAVLLAAGLIAAQLLPFWQLLQLSQRDAGASTDRWSLPIWGLGNFFEPLFHCFKTPEGIFFQPGQEFINSCYFTLPGLALAGLAWRRPRHWTALPLTLLLFLSITMAMGDQAFIYKWMREAFPALGVARFPVKFLLLSIMVVPALAALGLDGLLAPAGKLNAKTHPPPPRLWRTGRGEESKTGQDAPLFSEGVSLELRKSGTGRAEATRAWLVSAGMVLAGLGAVLWRVLQNPFYYDQLNETRWNGLARGLFLAAAIVALLGLILVRSPRIRGFAWLAFLALVAADLRTHVPWQNPSLPNDDFKPGAWSQATHFAALRMGEGRVQIAPAAEDRLLHSPLRDLESDYIGKRIALWSNLNLIEGVPKVNGAVTLRIRGEDQIENLLYRAPRRQLPRLLDFLGVVYTNDPGDILEWKRRPGAMPLVTAGQGAVFATNTLAAWVAGFDPRQAVVFPASLRAEIGRVPATEARIEEVSFSAERIRFHCDTAEKCLVVIAQSAYPAWRAYIDGQTVPLWPANHAFQALAAPAGRHEILLVYEDTWFHAGMFISVATLALCLALLRRSRGRTVNSE